ncbi:ubiquitin carboxyl-terminal hydrolase 29 [Lemur catta]|uniref:ubiquitin carboxyl-terminal hydrolase 29 n=1 Tax=Lemur catta TaxID=9447 RepID=UPI001E266F73|nr:ubiquitin carboxyl-terminal hydrolase 29 [Lemur catta]
MTPLQIHGFIQIWSEKTGMTELKEALIETVEGEKDIKLVVTFKSREVIRVFQLSNNIRSVVVRHYEENQSCLHLTLQNNISLLIDKLSFHDAEQLQMFLDLVHQNKFQQSMKRDNDWGVFESRNTQKGIDKTLFYKMCYEPSYRSFHTEKGSGMPFPQKMPLLMPKSPTLVNKAFLENRGEKRKKTLSSGLEMNEDFLKENDLTLNKKLKMDSSKCVTSNRKEPSSLKALEKDRNLKLGSSFKPNSNRNPNVEMTVLSTQTFSAKTGWALPLEKEHSQDALRSNNTQEKLWKGFPNLGNTCYMNAILQSLFAVPSFADDLLMQGLPWEKIPSDSVIMSLSMLFALKNICDRQTQEELLVNVKNAISAVAEVFSGNMQNDAHEFLGQCLDQLKEDIKKLNSVLKTERETGDENSSPRMYAGNALTKLFVCPVVANFEFELQLSIICKACGHAVLKTEPNNYLSINLHQEEKTLPLSIQNSFDLFFKAEELEYKCEMCNHNSSVAMHKFSRLPRVLIVHLKRYRFNDAWLLVKNEQQIYIPKYLSLSSHCNESTKSPPPLSSINVPVGDCKALKTSQELIPESISPSTLLAKSTSESSDSLVLHVAPDKNADLQRFQRNCEEVNQEHYQRDLENGSKPQSKLVNSEDKMVSEKELPVADSMVDQGDNCLPTICEDVGKPVGSPDTDLTEIHLQEVPKNPELKKYEETNTSVELDFDTVTESTSGFYEHKGNRIPEGSQGIAEELQQCTEKRIKEKSLQQASPPPPGHPTRKPDTQEHADEALGRSTDLRLQKANINSLRALDSDKSLGNKAILEMENTEDEAKEPKRNVKMRGPLQVYRLISVVSHIGNSRDAGHYISDAYDFHQQSWFTYDDLRVSEIPETLIQDARLHSGYIFFYMHNEVFETFEKGRKFSTT